jgi:outer membrane protein
MKIRTLVVLGLAIVGSAMAQTPRIALVDSKALFDGFKGTKDAQVNYDKQVAKWEQEVADKQKELANMKEKFEKQSLMMSDEKKRDLSGQFQSKQADLQRLVQDLYGKDGRVLKENEKFTAPIVIKIKGVVQQVAKAEGYDLVLDRASGTVLFVAKEDMDITQKVLDRLNSEYTGISSPNLVKPEASKPAAPVAPTAPATKP